MFELEHFNFPFVRYATFSEEDKFRDYKSYNFCSEEDMPEAVESMLLGIKNIDMREVSVKENYRNFFRSYIC